MTCQDCGRPIQARNHSGYCHRCQLRRRCARCGFTGTLAEPVTGRVCDGCKAVWARIREVHQAAGDYAERPRLPDHADRLEWFAAQATAKRPLFPVPKHLTADEPLFVAVA